jgi:predicted glycosyltransferase
VKVWVDLSNSPHALLFEPVVRALRADGHLVALTARDNAQTAELARARWPEVEIVGGESPRGRAGKAATLSRRAGALAKWARERRPDVAVSHNSYAQILAARLARVPAVTAMDYEHQPANHLAFRLAGTVLLPEAMRPLDLSRQGAIPAKTRFYPGLKEELYLGEFAPNPAVVDELGVERSPGRILVVARTPPSRALYHGAGNGLFIDALRAIAAHPAARIVVLPRHAEQRDALRALSLPRLTVPSAAIDSRSLLYAADLVIGAGGTMTREAALLGIPTYTVFAGRPAIVDAWLERRGRLRRLTSPAQLRRLTPRSEPPRTVEELRSRGEALLEHFIDAATSVRAALRHPSDQRRPLAGVAR